MSGNLKLVRAVSQSDRVNPNSTVRNGSLFPTTNDTDNKSLSVTKSLSSASSESVWLLWLPDPDDESREVSSDRLLKEVVLATVVLVMGEVGWERGLAFVGTFKVVVDMLRYLMRGIGRLLAAMIFVVMSTSSCESVGKLVMGNDLQCSNLGSLSAGVMVGLLGQSGPSLKYYKWTDNN